MKYFSFKKKFNHLIKNTNWTREIMVTSLLKDMKNVDDEKKLKKVVSLKWFGIAFVSY